MGCRRDATFLQVLEGGPVEGHRSLLSLRSAGGRLLHSLGAFAFEDKPRMGCSDLSILSEVSKSLCITVLCHCIYLHNVPTFVLGTIPYCCNRMECLTILFMYRNQEPS